MDCVLALLKGINPNNTFRIEKRVELFLFNFIQNYIALGGAAPNAVDSRCRTPLQCAIEGRHAHVRI